jgi:hypothetical protein
VRKPFKLKADLFGTMLSYIDGRVYYNLASWYRLMALLPAYKTNRTFMEGMMGLSQSASEVTAFENNTIKQRSLSLITSIQSKQSFVLALTIVA